MSQNIKHVLKMTDNEERYYREAKKIVKKKKDFRSSCIAFAIIIPFLAFINLMTNPRFLWFLFPMLGWGMGLIGEYYSAYVKPKRTSWEDQEVKKEMERMRRREREFFERKAPRDEFDERLDLREVRRSYDDRDFV